MSLSIYMDHNVPAAITDGLRLKEIDVLTAAEDGAADWDDQRLLERSTQLGRVLFTQDDDFLVLTHDWLKNNQEFSGVVYAHQLAVTIGQAIADLELIAKVIDPEKMYNRIEFLPIR